MKAPFSFYTTERRLQWRLNLVSMARELENDHAWKITKKNTFLSALRAKAKVGRHKRAREKKYTHLSFLTLYTSS